MSAPTNGTFSGNLTGNSATEICGNFAVQGYSYLVSGPSPTISDRRAFTAAAAQQSR